MTVQEVAVILGITPQAVRAHCRRGNLKAKLRPSGPKGVKSWNITGGRLLEEREAPQPGPEAPEAPQPGPEAPEAPQPGPEAPEAPEGSEEDSKLEAEEERWARLIRERAEGVEGSGEEGGEKPGVAEGRRFRFTPDSLRNLIRSRMPEDMWKRNEILLEIWCEVAPEFLSLDLDKVGKAATYGIPPLIVVGERLRAENLKRQKEREE